ncbi:MAG: hypothetical protein V4844_09440 [Pseudomonadota bacterium]
MAASTICSSGTDPGEVPANAPMAPGDEAPEGTPDTGETICPQCGGSGSVDGAQCSYCRGSGKINVGIGGA